MNRFTKLFKAVGTAAVFVSLMTTTTFAATTYQVRPHDSMWKIAQNHRVSLQALERANPHVVNPSLIYPGESITLPATVHSSPVVRSAAVGNTAVRHTTLGQTAVSSSDEYWLSRVIQAEAGGESYQAKLAVGNVVLHRVASPQYPNSIKGVIFQREYGSYAFTCVQNGFINRQPSADSINAARAVLYGHQDVVPGALVFYNPAQTPSGSWVRTQAVITQIGQLLFAR